jgi:hypothetical protein
MRCAGARHLRRSGPQERERHSHQRIPLLAPCRSLSLRSAQRAPRVEGTALLPRCRGEASRGDAALAPTGCRLQTLVLFCLVMSTSSFA